MVGEMEATIGGRTHEQQHDLAYAENIPKCGGTAILVEMRDDFEEIPDLGRPTEKVRIPEKVDQFRCQEQAANMNLRELSENQIHNGAVGVAYPVQGAGGLEGALSEADAPGGVPGRRSRRCWKGSEAGALSMASQRTLERWRRRRSRCTASPLVR
jgi:hypothetical protein